MCYVIFLVSVIGICLICFTVDNYWYLSCGSRENCGNIEIILTKKCKKYSDREEIISKIKTGNYNDILDVVDSIRIN